MPDAHDPRPAAPSAESVFGDGSGGARVRWFRLLLSSGLIGAAVLIAFLWSRDESAPPELAGHAHGGVTATGEAQPVMLGAEQARRIGVTFAQVEQGPMAEEVRTVAQVAFDETRVRTVSLKFDGWVDRLHVDFTGRDVRAGEPLLATYSPMLVSAEQELLLAQALLRDVAGSDSATVLGAQRLQQSARERLLNWDVPDEEVRRVESTGVVPKTLVIRAPYSGVIVDKYVLEGQRIMAGEPLYRIADLSTVWVEGEVFERDVPMVRQGQLVEIKLDARPGERRAGRIVFVQPTVNAQTRTLRIRVELDNRSGQLRPGMYATVRIRTTGSRVVLHVPRSAVLSTGRRDLVFVQRPDGVLEPRDVVRGISTDDRVEIRSGVKAGETVVASATFLVDAESNLGSALGGMAGMPGMAISTPPVTGSGAPPAAKPDSMATMPNMKHDH